MREITQEWLNQKAKEAHKINVDNGFYNNPASLECRLGLIMDELAEATEADRKDRRANLHHFFEASSIFPRQILQKRIFEDCIKDTFEDELADTVIRCLDMLAYEKGEYNCEESSNCLDFSQMKYKCGQYIYDVSTIELPENRFWALCFAIDLIIDYCIHHQIDLRTHIELKLEYNKSRSNKHGKRY